MNGAPGVPPSAARSTSPSSSRSPAKASAERLAIAGAAGLAVLKLVTGLAINSIGLLGAAADSLMDVAISTLNLFSIRLAESPADEGHPFGHGKVENLAGLAQAAVIAALGGWVVYAAVQRFVRGTRPEHTGWGVAVMLVSVVVSWLITRHLRRVGSETGSVVLLADSLHYATDVWTNAGILVALVLLELTGSAVFDPLIALGVGVLILRSAWQIATRSVQDLMDAALPEAEQREIARVILRHRFVVSSHSLRTRRAGSQRQIDFSVVACRHLPLGQTHDLVDHVEKEIEATVPGSHVVVHAEPCPAECAQTSGCVRSARPADLFAHETPHEA